ncbi:MAG: FAD-binding oxidoreductase [Dehalococcoidia bacterium]
MENDGIYNSLVGIVGEDYVSNRPEELFIYSTDSGTEGPRQVDYVAMPRTTGQVRDIILLANEYKVPITPMGANLTLNGLGLPVNGGIVLDMKRMDRIIELNKLSRYVTVEAGVTQGMLGTYLEKYSPDLEHSRPEAPPMATVAGNIVIRGHGYLSSKFGNNSHHVNGMEVVLPTGEICEIGATSVAPHPFGKGPLPDLTSLFCGWNGTTGIITRLTLKLFPKRKLMDVVGYVVNDLDGLPDVLYRVTQTDMVDNLFVIGFALTENDEAPQFITVTVTGELQEEIDYKKAVFEKMAAELDPEQQGKVTYLYPVPYELIDRFVEHPPYVSPARTADFERGGGFRYCGGIMPIDAIPQIWEKGRELAARHGTYFLTGSQILGYCHNVNFCLVYPFNRADEASVERTRQAMREAGEAVLEVGGIPWKAEVEMQRLISQKMNPNTYELIQRIKSTLDPNGIMNPGNWSK